jgi:arylsulfatase A-like enzyme
VIVTNARGSEWRRRRLAVSAAGRWLGWLAILSVAAGCGPRRPPNLILVTFDTTRADFCSLYGFPFPTTPVLEHLARDGVVFDAAMAPSTWTLPTHASLWTGLYPSQHGAISSLTADGEFGRPIPDSLPVLPEILARNGYQTAGFVGGPFVTRGFGFARGFEHYDDRIDAWGIDAVALNARISEWIAARRDGRPLFLFVNYYDPHRPYSPPSDLDDPFGAPERCRESLPRDFDPVSSGTLAGPLDVECARMQYAREIRAADRALGDLLDVLGRHAELGHAVIAVTGDHGEAFGENDIWTHGGAGFLHQSHVPLVLTGTGEAGLKARRIADGVSTARLPRTLLGLAGLPAPASWLGPSLLAASPADLAPLTEQFTREASYFALHLPGWTWLWIEPVGGTAGEQLFHGRTGEPERFVAQRDRPAEVMAAAHADWDRLRAEMGPIPRFQERRPELPPATRESLRALGYTK